MAFIRVWETKDDGLLVLCRRFRDPTPEEIQALTLEGMRNAVMSMLHPENVEIDIAGDFEPAELVDLVHKYLGTVGPRSQPPVICTTPPRLVQPQSPVRIQWHLRDSDERACAYITGTAPARWYSFGQSVPHSPVQAPLVLARNAPPLEVVPAMDIRRRHPLYPMVTLNLLTEIINGRLFTTVRDSLGLTYDVNFEISSFDRLEAGWFVVNVTSTPAKIQQALDASLRVLRNVQTDRVTHREVLRARRTVLTRHESDLKVYMPAAVPCSFLVKLLLFWVVFTVSMPAHAWLHAFLNDDCISMFSRSTCCRLPLCYCEPRHLQ